MQSSAYEHVCKDGGEITHAVSERWGGGAEGGGELGAHLNVLGVAGEAERLEEDVNLGPDVRLHLVGQDLLLQLDQRGIGRGVQVGQLLVRVLLDPVQRLREVRLRGQSRNGSGLAPTRCTGRENTTAARTPWALAKHRHVRESAERRSPAANSVRASSPCKARTEPHLDAFQPLPRDDPLAGERPGEHGLPLCRDRLSAPRDDSF